MPIYDHRCAACGRRFSVLFRSYAQVGAVRCEHCGSDRVDRLAPRIARVTSEDARLDRLSDPSSLGDLDEGDPASVARWAKRLGSEMGEDLGEDIGDEPDQTPDEADSSTDDE